MYILYDFINLLVNVKLHSWFNEKLSQSYLCSGGEDICLCNFINTAFTFSCLNTLPSVIRKTKITNLSPKHVIRALLVGNMHRFTPVIKITTQNPLDIFNIGIFWPISQLITYN